MLAPIWSMMLTLPMCEGSCRTHRVFFFLGKNVEVNTILVIEVESLSLAVNGDIVLGVDSLIAG